MKDEKLSKVIQDYKKLQKNIADYRSLSVLIKEAQEELDAVKLNIIQYMKDYNKEEVFTNDAKITYKSSHRSTFSSKLLAKALGEENLDYYKTTSSFHVLKVY